MGDSIKLILFSPPRNVSLGGCVHFTALPTPAVELGRPESFHSEAKIVQRGEDVRVRAITFTFYGLPHHMTIP